MATEGFLLNLISRVANRACASVQVSMRSFVPASLNAKFDRITIGPCLQKQTGSSCPVAGDLAFCMDKVVMVTLT